MAAVSFFSNLACGLTLQNASFSSGTASASSESIKRFLAGSSDTRYSRRSLASFTLIHFSTNNAFTKMNKKDQSIFDDANIKMNGSNLRSPLQEKQQLKILSVTREGNIKRGTSAKPGTSVRQRRS